MLKLSPFVVGCLAGAFLLLPVIEAQPAWSQDRQLLGTTPQVQQQRPQRVPGQHLQVAPDRPGVVLRTHCNGTCMCTGLDCTQTWKDTNCKDVATCSGDDNNADRVCSCVKKEAQ
jgi:hypothetical protein